LVRDRGTVLTSATSATSACFNKFTNSARGRVECPIVKTGKVIRACDGRLEIEVASTPMQLKKRGKGVVAVPNAKLPALTAKLVRETLKRVRR
jgi:hypothetical protein